MDKTKRHSKARVSNTLFSKHNICNSRRARMPLCKSKTSLGKAYIIFSDSIFGDGLQEGLTSFQNTELAAPNSLMAKSCEHSSI